MTGRTEEDEWRPGRRTAWVTTLACALLVAILGLSVARDWGPLLRLDHGLGMPAGALTRRHEWLVQVLLVVEAMFGTLGTVLYTAVLMALAGLKRRGRVIGWGLAVVVATSLTTTALKLLVRRTRPVWDDPVQTLTSFSYPSGHASGILSGMGVALVVMSLFVGPGLLRRSFCALAVALVVVVGADRVLLGVHNLSDVLGGYAVAGFWLALVTNLYPPALPDGPGLAGP
ncbi:MAG: PA-phosphatase [Nocardioides sp.]|nr:PA-phosphatase [Nocardioides sp.]